MKFAPLLSLAFCCAAPVWADVVILGAAKDTMTQNGNPDNADGGGAGLFAGTNGNGSPHRILIAFSLNGIPAGATITNVQLTLTLALTAGQMNGGVTAPDSATINIFDLTRNWSQGTAGSPSESSGIGASGGGFTAGLGDATWNSAFNGQTLWTTAGGDYGSTASDTLLLNGNTVGTAFTWLSTSRMVADVQGWLNNPSTNFGWELINADEVDVRTLYGFYSSEWATFPGGLASQEPALQVTFIAPEPATGSLALFAGLIIFSLRPLRRRV